MSFLFLGFKMDQSIDLILICSCLWIFVGIRVLKKWLVTWHWYDSETMIYIYYRYIVTTCITCTSTAYCLHYTCAATMQTLPGCFGFAVESTPCLFRLYPRVATRSEISISESFPCWLMHWFMFHHAPNSQNTRAVLWIRVRFLIWFRLSFALPIVCSCHR